MQLTAKHQEYWSKNLRITALLLGIWFFVTFRGDLFRERINVQLFWLAVLVLGGGARCSGGLLPDHLVLCALHEQSRQ
jgi:uncharacterized membrane-anchored protein